MSPAPPPAPSFEQIERMTGPAYDPAHYGVAGGWFWAAKLGLLGEAEAHILPINDLRQHQLDEECWCEPMLTHNDKHGRAFTHQALDGRQSIEQGRKPS